MATPSQPVADLGRIAQLLDATLDPDTHRQAEAALRREASKPQYTLSLLNIVQSTTLGPKTRLAAAIAFKNFVRTSYVDEDGNYRLPETEVAVIKQQVIGLMISCPPPVQSQLGEAISIMADSDFWTRWESLTADLVGRLSLTDAAVNVGVLEVAHSIFVRWRPLFPTDELYTEINHVIATFGQPLLTLLINTNDQIEANANNRDVLRRWFETLDLLIKIFHDMSCQDIPPIFEDNLAHICELLLKFMCYTNPVLNTDDDADITLVNNVKADICEVLQLYTNKYDEDFGKYCQPFITAAWNLLSRAGPQTKYDHIVSKALQFLTAIAASNVHAAVFDDEAVLTQIVEKVILPNVALREADIEQFEDEPIEFIRRDLEGSDADSRRRASTDFLRKLQEKFEGLVTATVSKYIAHYLEQGKTDWKAKDTAVYLFFSIAVKGSATTARGVRTVNPLVNVVDFFERHIASDLLSQDGVKPMAKVDAIKYLYTFRSQLSKDQWALALPPLIRNMDCDDYVVYTYAAIAVERVLYLTDDHGTPVFQRAEVEPSAKSLLDHLFKLIEKQSQPAKLQENEYLMSCIMRILIVIKDGAIPHLNDILTHLNTITTIIKQNPSNPRFYYYHFESIGSLVRYCSASKSLWDKVWSPIQDIITEDVAEFIPYVFQILGLMLELCPTDSSRDVTPVLVSLLTPKMWDARGNVPACTRLLGALMPTVALQAGAENSLEQILGIFERLILSKKLDLHSFDILDAVVRSFQPPILSRFFPTILRFIFQKLQGTPSESFRLSFARFYHNISARPEAGYGADYFFQQSELVQAGIFTQVYPTFVLNETKKFLRPVDRKLAVISYTKTLCESRIFAERFEKGWANTFRMLMDLLGNPPIVAEGVGNELITEADVDDIGFGLTFTPLNTCKVLTLDHFLDVTDVVPWVRSYTLAADQRHAGAISTFIDQRLPPDLRQAFLQYLQ